MNKVKMNGNGLTSDNNHNTDDFDDNDSRSSNDSNDDDYTHVQLGVIRSNNDTSGSQNVLFKSKQWNLWDGGKIGGEPIWLNPEIHPTIDDLTCLQCNQVMKFLLQIYCPLDDIKNAFHRCLYLFICPHPECVLNGQVKCFRSQLPRLNKYYPYDSTSTVTISTVEKFNQTESTCISSAIDNDVEKVVTGMVTDIKLDSINMSLCQTCKLVAKFVCARCKSIHYCCKEHQKEDWKVHKVTCRISFTEYSLHVSEEILNHKKNRNDDDDDDDDEADKAMIASVPPEAWEKVPLESGEKDEDALLTQNDFNEAAGVDRVDNPYEKFLDRIRKGDPKQVLRYCRWPSAEEVDKYSNGPLSITINAHKNMRCYKLLSSSSSSSSSVILSPSASAIGSSATVSSPSPSSTVSSMTIPFAINYDPILYPSHHDTCMRCCVCGRTRLFEFQIMPQLLHYLGVDRATKINKKTAHHKNNHHQQQNDLTSTNNAIEKTKTDGQSMNEKDEIDEDIFVNMNQDDFDFGTLDIYTCPASCDIYSHRKSGGIHGAIETNDKDDDDDDDEEEEENVEGNDVDELDIPFIEEQVFVIPPPETIRSKPSQQPLQQNAKLSSIPDTVT